ncbi:MAG TPA: long-chain fatty acid--CoA ligase [Methylomirabilota bacterium]|nr:long-chain fatty acid--CoA ligase [Methylomirabilota bacterium]
MAAGMRMPAAPDHGVAAQADTLARVFWCRVETSGPRPAQMIKHRGAWQTLTWAEVGTVVRELALGLLALGSRPGERVAILSRSRAEWIQADFAVLSVGGVSVPIYPTYPAEQIVYVVNDADARLLVVEDPTQLVKVMEVRGKMAGLEQVVVMQGYEGQDAWVLTSDALRRLGREQADRLGSALADRTAAIRPDDVATIVYTSGTTGPPKGVIQTHANHLAALAAAAQATPVEPGDLHLLFLPLAHAFARLEGFMGPYLGLVTAFSERLDRVPDELREVRPHFICAVPRFFEMVHARILAGAEASPRLQQALFAWAIRVGRAVSARRQARRPTPAWLRLEHAVASRLVFSKLDQALGGRLRFAVSGGAPLPREVAEFFHALGILILEGYGLTETCPVLTFNRADRFRFGSVGLPLTGVELKLAADGEILARGPNVATRGYWRKPEATAEAFETGGWLRTGDVGRIDEEGFLFITDRKKDLIVTSSGANIAPQLIESLLKVDPLVGEAMVYGDRRPYAVALISVNQEQLGRLAEAQGISEIDSGRLAVHPAVRARLTRLVEEANARLPSYARIKRFAVLPVPLTEEAGELTPSLKVKRAVVARKYRELLESLYEAPAVRAS